MGYRERQEKYEKMRAEKELRYSNWHRVEVTWSTEYIMLIEDWIISNCHGKWSRSWKAGTTIPMFLFESENDAAWFALKWG